METMFVTITGTNHYYGLKPFKVGGIVKLVKDKHNDFDSEAIQVKMPYIDTVGFVANSPNTTFKGTCSAGRIMTASVTILLHGLCLLHIRR